jgi:ectoine hydroxylase-related dioxygenase (phytanoyl-CoA dioxygenase family)
MAAAPSTASKAQIDQWVEQFNRDGYLFLEEVLIPEFCAELRADLDAELARLSNSMNGKSDEDANLRLRVRMFEHSRANVRLFEQEPIVSFAEALLTEQCHVVHNNSFITKRGGGLSGWHQDDPPHLTVTHGDAPTNIRLRCLLFTANYYLTDVTERKHGGTEVIPGSHLFGKPCPSAMDGTEYAKRVVPCLGKAGSVVLFNNQVWHRGGPNESDRVRYITQVSYAWRIIGHRYAPFMNYQMPEHVYAGAGPRLKRLLGFLPSGAYG